MKNTKVAIIGAGAAGMMAAATILESQPNCEIHLFEKNPSLGKKVIISGGGRCNVTTGITNRQILMKKYTRGSEFLKVAISKFPPEQVYAWFEDHGVPLKTEEDMRVFPVSNDGHDIVNVFQHIFDKHDVHLHFKTGVKKIEKQNNQFLIKCDNQEFLVDFVLIATGGNAYRHTGSTGDGYAFAKDLGHTITPLGPSLNSFFTREEWPKSISGLSLENVEFRWNKIAVQGPMLFTHFGISGPATFSLSSQLAFEKIDAQHPLIVSFFPVQGMRFEDWEQLFITAYKDQPKKQIKNILHEYFPQRLVAIILKIAQINERVTANELNKDDRKELSHLLSGKLQLTFTQRRPGDEFVTAGGVATSEINKQTMESTICPGLYFAGEIMDVDGVTGGFNLQASWAAGRLAGKSIAKQCK